MGEAWSPRTPATVEAWLPHLPVSVHAGEEGQHREGSGYSEGEEKERWRGGSKGERRGSCGVTISTGRVKPRFLHMKADFCSLEGKPNYVAEVVLTTLSVGEVALYKPFWGREVHLGGGAEYCYKKCKYDFMYTAAAVKACALLWYSMLLVMNMNEAPNNIISPQRLCCIVCRLSRQWWRQSPPSLSVSGRRWCTPTMGFVCWLWTRVWPSDCS